MSSNTNVIGRFAPSPSGPLHFGSLVAALGSFLHARSRNGQWLLRIEDIDPPREMPGATQLILASLKAHGLQWDGEVVYQSQRSQAYDKALMQLQQQGQLYGCGCTRAQWRAAAGHCDCRLRQLSAEGNALRFYHQKPQQRFIDGLLGELTLDSAESGEDFVVKRKDGLYAYQLAVVVDDIAQGVTEVVRGADLLDATPFQLALYQALGQPPPAFVHLPVVVSEPGKKLSKQNHAKPLDNQQAAQNLSQALAFLGHPLPTKMTNTKVGDILDWASDQWQLGQVPAVREALLQ